MPLRVTPLRVTDLLPNSSPRNAMPPPPSRRALVGTGLVGAAAALTGTLPTGTAVAQPSVTRWKEDEGQRYSVPGLKRPVRVTVDVWGVPHLFAENAGDLFQAQGFNVARERLFQIDTWRRRGLGRISEVLGASYVEQDRAARLFLYRGDMASEWASYGPEAREAATRFAAGINAYLDWLDGHPDALPAEFQKLGYRPARWNPEDVVRIRTHGIGNSLTSQVARARLMSIGGNHASRYYRKLEPDHAVQVPEGLDLSLIPADVLAVYGLATSPMVFADGTLRRMSDGLNALRETATGSNAWAVAPARTATGRPILAGDPHRENYTLPANRYIAHLSAPGLNIIGAGEPWSPGITMGHNGNVAFGLTNLPADQADLYVYELDPNDHGKYRYRDRWEKMTTVREEIPVAGGEPRQAQLSFTRHGPVIKTDEKHHRAYAVRTVWTEPGTSPYLGSLNFQRAKDSNEFIEAISTWKLPGSNLVYADTKGDIGWVPGAIIPKRRGRGYDGLLPVPGDGRFEWDGFYANAQLPAVRNPRAGFFVSANEYNFPAGYPTPTYDWQPAYRKDRIHEVLSPQRRTSLADTLALQNDEKSGVARQFLPYLKKLRSTDPTTAKALRLLSSYDGVADKDSAAAALFETWTMRYLYPAWTQLLLPKPAADQLVGISIDFDVRIMNDSFARPDDWFGANGAQKRDTLLLSTLPKAHAEVASRLGADESAWRWGAMHIHLFMHPLGGPNVGPVERGGSFATVSCSYFYHPEYPYTEVIGPTFKMALDVGGWDNSRVINAPGQSGDQRSKHYSDLHDKWSAGEYFPLLYSEQAIERNGGTRILLEP
ncbi:penicillin acylase family protein [Streptomyces tubercidicus]|uniref:penicillin acylase family protein n=1 Tax=Streptomyces tubercidicus TaxID=47759 RepID=UPI0037A88AB2